MPGPEAAGAIPPPPTTSPAAPADNVIDLTTRALARNTSKDAPMAAPEPPPQDPLLERLAIEAESLFIAHNRTLSDPATADAYRIALDLALLLLDGALAKGHIGDDGYRRLHGTLAAAQLAPDCL
ncbi:hypothetical protein [Streptomyces lydicus]|uniref:hypothetical protein n=1 Tax=Streptomyces lydicus TaxID=47763 RepID=UPI00380D9263